ncbi:MAG: dipeptide epimerase [Myxococcota bacterium]
MHPRSPVSIRLHLDVAVRRFPIAGGFRISRGAKTEAEVVEVRVRGAGHCGRGEAVPYARYGASVGSVVAALEGMADGDLDTLRRGWSGLTCSVARNALDGALIDWACRFRGRSVAHILGVSPPVPVVTAFTLSVDTPEKMAARARCEQHRRLFKLKVRGDDDDLARVEAVHRACPDTPLIVDANEGWTLARYRREARGLASLGVVLLEQPLPADADHVLHGEPRPVPLCADESFLERRQLPALRDRYDAVNVKLDKVGGLTEAIPVIEEAEACGLDVMLGCNVCSSLGVAPLFHLAPRAAYVDLDGPLLLEEDRPNGVTERDGLLHPPKLWGIG